MNVTTQPRKHRERSVDRPRTGSLLFPDVVWAHWVWQTESRPHPFASARGFRQWLRDAGHRNERLTAHNKNGRGQRGDLGALKQDYEEALDKFQNSEGRIIRAYWCATEASAVVLTEQKNRHSWLPWRRMGSMELHRATEWVTEDAPAIAELLHSGDTLAIRINRVLTAVPRRIAMEWVFSEQSYLLGFVERTGGHPSRKELGSTIARHGAEIDRLERYYDRAARKTARIEYFGGMLVGLLVVVGLGALIPFVIEPFGHIDLGTPSLRRFYACFVAGAIGAMVSVMTRMRQEEGMTLDYEVGELLIVMLGAFRPVLGAIFGVLAYFAIDSGFLPIKPTGIGFFYFALFAFAAGFSERFAHVILGGADLTLAKAMTGGGTPAPAASTQAKAPNAVRTGSQNAQTAPPARAKKQR